MDGYICVHHGWSERDGSEEGFLSDYKLDGDEWRHWSLNGEYMIGNVSLRETSEIAAIYYTENERDRAITQAQRILDKVF